MERSTFEQILKKRKLRKSGSAYSVPEDEVASLLVGRGTVSALAGLVSFDLQDGFILVTTRKETQTYVEYDMVRAVSFEPKEVADRRTGFV